MTTVEPINCMGESVIVPEVPCVICGEPGTVQVCPYSGNTLEALCPACIRDEPGDSFYEGRG